MLNSIFYYFTGGVGASSSVQEVPSKWPVLSYLWPCHLHVWSGLGINLCLPLLLYFSGELQILNGCSKDGGGDDDLKW